MGQNKAYLGKNLKIGVLGGTFNPVHLGHMHMAKCAMEKLQLDRVVFMANGIPPHKQLDFNTSPKDRLKMLSLAIDKSDKYFIDDYEAFMDEKAYSHLSLERIHKDLDDSSTLYFIIGADSLMQLHSWRYPEKLLSMCKFAVVPRGDYTKDDCLKKIDELQRSFGGEIIYLDCKKLKMSSTKARNFDFAEKTNNLDKKVVEYIRRNGLYKNMTNTKGIEEYLKKNLKKKRLDHVYGTVKEAEKLAEFYGEDIEKAKLAALLHDCAKHMDKKEVLFLAEEYGFEIDDIYALQPELLHGVAGAYVAKNIFQVYDEDVLNAIIHHTVPRLNMSNLEKLISVADLIEKTRDYPGVDDLRKLKKDGLDVVFKKTLERIIIHVVERNQLLHTNSVVVYNNLLKDERKSDKLKQTQGDK